MGRCGTAIRCSLVSSTPPQGFSREETIRALNGGESIVRLAQNAGVSRTRFSRLAEAAASAEILYPGFHRVIRRLSAEEVPLGVVTSLPGWIALPVLSAVGLNEIFAQVVHAGSGLGRKPNPAGIRAVLETIGVPPTGRVFYAGDQERDGQTARNAGVSFAWASYGYSQDTPEFVTVRLQTAADLSRL